MRHPHIQTRSTTDSAQTALHETLRSKPKPGGLPVTMLANVTRHAPAPFTKT